MTATPRVRVAVSGAAGRMGQEVVRAVLAESDLELVAAVDPSAAGSDVGALAAGAPCGVVCAADASELAALCPDVLVDFTRADISPQLVRAALAVGAHCVVGTTGLAATDLAELESAAQRASRAVLVAPNFALGAVLMMRFASQAARYYPWAEIIELHHEKKIDAPSGTALRTADMMRAASPIRRGVEGALDKLEGARGADAEGIRIHSVRLPGLLAHQEVILGGLGETLTIRHDSTARTSFMPGVVLAVREIRARVGLLVGLETLLDLG